MSTVFKGANATNIAGSIPKLAEEGQQNGVKKLIFDTYTFGTDTVANDSILMGGLIPAGAMILGCDVTCGALGASGTFDVGWNASADAVEAQNKTAFFSGLAVTSAATQGMGASTGTPGTVGYVLKSAVQPALFEKAVTTSATGLSISMAITYVET